MKSEILQVRNLAWHWIEESKISSLYTSGLHMTNFERGKTLQRYFFIFVCLICIHCTHIVFAIQTQAVWVLFNQLVTLNNFAWKVMNLFDFLWPRNSVEKSFHYSVSWKPEVSGLSFITIQIQPWIFYTQSKSSHSQSWVVTSYQRWARIRTGSD